MDTKKIVNEEYNTKYYLPQKLWQGKREVLHQTQSQPYKTYQQQKLHELQHTLGYTYKKMSGNKRATSIHEDYRIRHR